MIRTTSDAIQAYEKRTGFVGIGTYLVARGVLSIIKEQPTVPSTAYYKALSEGV